MKPWHVLLCALFLALSLVLVVLAHTDPTIHPETAATAWSVTHDQTRFTL